MHFREFEDLNAKVQLYDPWVESSDAEAEYGIKTVSEPQLGVYDAIIIAVAHREFREMGIDKIRSFGKSGAIVFDVKYLFSSDAVDGRL